MKITKEDVEHVGALARIEISESEKTENTEKLSEILNYVEKLKTAETDKVETINQISSLENVFRKDSVISGLTVEEVLQNAPAKEANFIKVGKVF